MFFTPCAYCFLSGNSKYVFRSRSVFHGNSIFLQAVKCSMGRLLKSSLFNRHLGRFFYQTCRNKVAVNEISGCLCCWTLGQCHWIFPEIYSQAQRCFQENQENCKVPKDCWSTWGFNNFGVCVILCFCSLRFWNASVTISIRQVYDASFIFRNAIIATKFDDEI